MCVDLRVKRAKYNGRQSVTVSFVKFCITLQQLSLASGEENYRGIKYDALVLATGTRHYSPFKYDPDVEDESISRRILQEMADKVSELHA